jgi:hypothetical protein
MGKTVKSGSVFCQIIGALWFLTLTWHDLVYTINKYYQAMRPHTEEYWMVVMRVLYCDKHTLDHGLKFWVGSPLMLQVYIDFD